MKTSLKSFLARYGGVIFLAVGIAIYVSISGMFGGCPTCQIITKSVGLPFLGQ